MEESLKYKNMRTRKEIVDKENELYELAKRGILEPIRAILYSDALEYALGEDYLNFEYAKEEVFDELS